MHLVTQRAKQAWIARAEGFFAQHDVLITPTLATMPPKAQQWSRKGWLANVVPSIRLTLFSDPGTSQAFRPSPFQPDVIPQASP